MRIGPQVQYMVGGSCLSLLLALGLAGYDVLAYPHSQSPDSIALSERIYDSSQVAAMTLARDASALYLLEQVGVLRVRDNTTGILKIIGTPVADVQAFAIGPDKRLYLADAFGVHVVDERGREVRSFPVSPGPRSLTVLSDGRIVAAAPGYGRVLHMFDPTGRWLRSFGDERPCDAANAKRCVNLNAGQVVSGPSDVIYYVRVHATEPSVQKFSADGRLLADFPVRGDAVDVQAAVAQRLFTVFPDSPDVLTIITSAAVDQSTGHLWISMNASNRTAPLYEYDDSGTKLREYRFTIGSGAVGAVSAVDAVAVRVPSVFVQTKEGVFHFLGGTTAGSEVLRAAGDLWRVAVRRTFGAPLGSVTLLADYEGCPPAVTPGECKADCPSGSPSGAHIDCRAILSGHAQPGCANHVLERVLWFGAVPERQPALVRVVRGQCRRLRRQWEHRQGIPVQEDVRDPAPV